MRINTSRGFDINRNGLFLVEALPEREFRWVEAHEEKNMNLEMKVHIRKGPVKNDQPIDVETVSKTEAVVTVNQDLVSAVHNPLKRPSAYHAN